MYAASPFSSPFASARNARHVYREVAIQSQSSQSADAHNLVQMLFDGFFEALARARGAMRNKDITGKCDALSRAVAIIDQGLRAALDMQQGGSLARDLHELYSYVSMRLTQANLRNDERALDECASLIKPLAEAWASIRPGAAA
jgi:flagellar secretion chaperone FliS